MAMTLEQALEELRVLNDRNDELRVLALVPDRHSLMGLDRDCWTVRNVINDKCVEIGCGDTPIAAIQAAKEKLAEQLSGARKP